jgi:hypothetical protein
MNLFDYKYETFSSLVIANPAEDIVQKIIIDTFPYAFSNNPENYWHLRSRICNKFHVHPQNFTIIGSAKLGFSLNPDTPGKLYSDASDIDIVLVSDYLFESIWLNLISYRNSVYYRLDSYAKQRFNELQMVLFWGQLRLDKLSNSFDFAKDWWEFFNELSTDNKYGNKQIRAAIFKSWHHATNYYVKSVNQIREQL